MKWYDEISNATQTLGGMAVAGTGVTEIIMGILYKDTSIISTGLILITSGTILYSLGHQANTQALILDRISDLEKKLENKE